MDLYLAGRPAGLAGAVRGVFRAFNGLTSLPAVLPNRHDWQSAHARWHRGLLTQTDLCSQLVQFVDRKQA